MPINKWRLFNKLQEKFTALNLVSRGSGVLLRREETFWVAYQTGHSPTYTDGKFTSNVEEAALRSEKCHSALVKQQAQENKSKTSKQMLVIRKSANKSVFKIEPKFQYSPQVR